LFSQKHQRYRLIFGVITLSIGIYGSLMYGFGAMGFLFGGIGLANLIIWSLVKWRLSLEDSNKESGF
ncbi:MAG: hypothetical protein ACYS0I_03055, partial [Planctomycetota bacterium]|jgi:hypothetical protein